jgi:hypothetical protein
MMKLLYRNIRRSADLVGLILLLLAWLLAA